MPQSDLKQGEDWGLIGYPLAPMVREGVVGKCLALLRVSAQS